MAIASSRGAHLRDVDRELDAVAIDDEGRVTALGSCKWTAGALPHSEKTKLDLLARHLLPDGPSPRLFFFSRNGFDDELVEDARQDERVRLVAPSDLYGS